jgi:thioredoxin-like negative regulator of GroEL
VSLIGIAQALIGLDWIPQATPPASTFANRNMASHHVAICFPLILGLTLLSSRFLTRVLGASCLLLSVLYLFYARTHAAWLAVLVVVLATAVSLPWLLQRIRRTGERTRLIYGVAALLLGACLIGFFFGKDPLHSDERGVQRVTAAVGIDSGSIDLRLIFWKNTLAMVRDHPVLGVGLGNFELQYPLYHRSAEIDWTFDEEHQLERAHNDHLQILAELGLIGFAAWISIFAGACSIVRRGLRKTDGWIPLQMLFVALGIASFLVVACFSFPMERAMPPIYLFALLGMAGALHLSGCAPTRGEFRVPSMVVWAGVLLLVLLLSTSVLLIRKAVLSDLYCTRAAGLAQAGEHARALRVLGLARSLAARDVDVLLLSARIHAETEDCDRAIELLREVLTVQPYNVNALSNIGYCYMKLQRFDDAERYLLSTREILPDSPQVHTNLGSTYFGQGRHDLAIDAYRKAIELAKTRPFLPSVRIETRLLQPQLLLANAYVDQGRLEEAIGQYEEILEHRPDLQDVRRLLAELHRTVGEPEKARKPLENRSRDESR